MRPDEAAWLARIEGVLAHDEQALDRQSPLRSFPMDLVAVQTMWQMARSGGSPPFTDEDITTAIHELETRNRT